MEDSMMSNSAAPPRILFVTPEAAFMPEKDGNRTNFVRANASGFGDFPAELIGALCHLGVDVHMAQPDYRRIFAISARNEQTNAGIKLPIGRIHLAEDRAFFYAKPINSNYDWENLKISLVFQPRIKMIAAESRSDKIQYRLFFPDRIISRI
jgi:starch synthase/alpha-amylase